jgi:HK97 family phage prohead protease
MHVKNVPLGRVKAGPDDGLEEGQFIVYPSTFTREPDSYGDVVAKGAFLETIAEWKESGNTLPGLYGHRMDDPDFFVAGAIDQGEDEHGWWVKGEFDLDSPKGPQVYRLVKGRRLNQLSFAFDVLEEGAVELDDGTKANELRKLKVYEYSFVPIGANQDTSVVAVKALAETIAADVKAGRALSAKNETALKEAVDKISGAADDIKTVLSTIAGANNDQEPKASGSGRANDEEPQRAKSEEPRSELSADDVLAVISIDERN